MNNRYITFTENTQMIINDIFKEAAKIWGGEYNTVRILAGNYSGYGKYIARYRISSSLIEIPVNPTFGMVNIVDEGIEVADINTFKSVLLHELAHHYEKQINDLDLIAGHTTHSSPKWCHVCAIGWTYYDKSLDITSQDLARGIRDNVAGLKQVMSHFDPCNPPYEILEQIRKEDGHSLNCYNCNSLFVSKRSDAKFCSDRCRVASSRKRAQI